MTSSPPDIRLIAVDMDGTLLDGDGAIPASLWPLLDDLHERGVLFAPASGRQLATLQRSFARAPGDEMVYIAENGTFVVRGDEVIGTDALDSAFAASVVARLRALVADGVRIATVVCGLRTAYIETLDDEFRSEVDKYYAKLEVVDDLLAVEDRILKIAIYNFDSAEQTAPALEDLRATHQVVVSGHHWIDIMNGHVNKGVALARVREALGITRAQTAAFGDYLNDLELLDEAEWSYAMANAHPEVRSRARFLAPSNRDEGVITTIRALLQLPG